jgi:hypothetical protein
MKQTNFKFRFPAICIIALCVSAAAYAQQRPVNPDGIELPDHVIEWQDRYNVQLLSNRDIILYENSGYYDPFRKHRDWILGIEQNETETLVTTKTEIYWDWNWLFQDKGTCLIDRKTGDRYMLRDISGVRTPGRMAAVYGLQGRSIVTTLVFPPLKKDVKVVDYFSPANYRDIPTRHNASGTHRHGIVLKKYAKQKQKQKRGEIIR